MDRIRQWQFRRALLFLLNDQPPVLLVLMGEHCLTSSQRSLESCLEARNEHSMHGPLQKGSHIPEELDHSVQQEDQNS